MPLSYYIIFFVLCIELQHYSMSLIFDEMIILQEDL